MKIYTFAGEFKDRAEACLYSEPQWEPEPDESVSDEEYRAWEDRNPTHRLNENLDAYLDSDFIETVDLNYDYLASLNISDEDIDKIRKIVSPNFNYMVLVFEDALGGFELNSPPTSTEFLKYCGTYEFSWKSA
ncbi:MAG: hypothetical protein ABW098_03180 [Candidatus Thiodiazotropha sp.]